MKTITVKGHKFTWWTEIPPGAGPDHTRYYWQAKNPQIAALLPAQSPPSFSEKGMRYAIEDALRIRRIPAKR